MTLLEDRLNQAANEVRQGANRMQVGPAAVVSARHRHARAAMATAAVSALVLAFVAIGTLTGGTGDVAREETAASVSTTPTAIGSRDDVSQTPDAALWIEGFAVWVNELGYETDEVDYWETATPVEDGGSLFARVDDQDAGVSLQADFQAFAEGEYSEDSAWQMEVAGSTTPGTNTGDGMVFVFDSPDDQMRASLVSELGVITIEVSSSVGAAIPDADKVTSVAVEMARVAGEIAGGGQVVDDMATTTMFEPTEPTDADWIQLAPDVWIAQIEEPGGLGTEDRLWIKTDTQDPAVAPSTDTRLAMAHAGSSDLIVLVFESPDDPLPISLTVSWSDGRSDTGDVIRTNDGDVGIARLSQPTGVELEDVSETP